MSDASNNEPKEQAEIERQTPDRCFAFVSHTSLSLKDSKVLWPSSGCRVHSIGMHDGELVAVTHTLGAAFGGRKAEEVLGKFCQKIYLLFRTDTRALGIASVIAEQLFKSVDDKGSFNRETMPLGIQGVQELNWTTQNEELTPLRQEYQRRAKDKGKQLTPFSTTDSNGNELLFAGPHGETMIMIDKSMLSAGIVKYRHHTFDMGFSRATCSWQLFVKINHRDFVRSWFQSSLSPVQDMGVALLTAMRIFSDARHLFNDPGKRTEAAILVETIRRAEFYMNSTVVDEETAAASETLTPTDLDVSAKSGSGHDISAGPDSSSHHDNSSSRPASSSSSPASDSSFSSSTIGGPSIPETTANMTPVSTKKSKKKKSTRKKPPKKTAAQNQTPENQGIQTSGDESLRGIVDQVADITLSGQSTTSSLMSTPPLPAGQPDAGNPLKGTSAAQPSTETKQGGNNGTPSKTRTAEERDQDLDDAISRHSSDSERTITQADFSNEDVTVSSSSKGQLDNEQERGRGAVVANDKEHTKRKDAQNSKATSGTHTTTSTGGGLNSYKHTQPVIQEAAGPSAKFKFDGFDPRLRCLKPDCRNMTSCWDCAVVICPACGTDSFTRYCRKQHLYDDLQRHWVAECRRNKINGPIDRDTIRAKQLPKRPYVVGQYHNIVERHRQAVYRAMEDADYFIFNDVEMLDDSVVQPTQEQWNSVRGTGEPVLQIVFPDDMTPYSDRQVFNYHIQLILTVGKPLAEDSCLKALEMIRSALVMSGSWTEEILTYLCMQLTGEWGNFKVPGRFYDVAEVNAMWQRHHILLPA
ncbi:hypothetical protein AYL99_06984 [Fonsecaea erecta]|uniref:Uncharacterized protein n=1 Tax=Fonsecaea erecta TaxID=1367422 RepID=A0A178ZJV5_9EURO|nr:hypothetical protein AYL99_06984 [Fonsecaea erecta]OAP59686.1 hypothetical protein AYL99_06984 [Fonsecaea erecta]